MINARLKSRSYSVKALPGHKACTRLALNVVQLIHLCSCCFKRVSKKDFEVKQVDLVSRQQVKPQALADAGVT